MLGILWLILKIILIIIGVILGIALLLIAILLFSFLRYNGNGSTEEEINVRFEFKWLLGFIKGYYEIKGDVTKYCVTLPFGLWKTEYNSEEESLNLDIEEKNICNNDDFSNKTIANIEKNSKIEYIGEKLKGIYNSVKNFVLYIIDKIKYVQNFNDKYSINDLISASLKLLLKLIKNLGFKIFEINGAIGFDDPSTTGQVIGVIAVVREFLPFSVNVCGNFDESQLTGDFNIKGRTNLWQILFPILVYVLTKPVWPLVKDYWKGELDG